MRVCVCLEIPYFSCMQQIAIAVQFLICIFYNCRFVSSVTCEMQDKVANVWCSLSTVIKFKQLFEVSTLVNLRLVQTLQISCCALQSFVWLCYILIAESVTSALWIRHHQFNTSENRFRYLVAEISFSFLKAVLVNFFFSKLVLDAELVICLTLQNNTAAARWKQHHSLCVAVSLFR